MTTAASPHRRWLLPAAILVAMGLYLWADPATVLRTRQSEQAIKDDPNSGAGFASTSGSFGIVQARTVDSAALADLLEKSVPKMAEPVVFAVVLDAGGRVSDVRIVGGTLSPEIASRAVRAIEGQKLFEPVHGAPTVRTVVTYGL